MLPARPEGEFAVGQPFLTTLITWLSCRFNLQECDTRLMLFKQISMKILLLFSVFTVFPFLHYNPSVPCSSHLELLQKVNVIVVAY